MPTGRHDGAQPQGTSRTATIHPPPHTHTHARFETLLLGAVFGEAPLRAAPCGNSALLCWLVPPRARALCLCLQLGPPTHPAPALHSSSNHAQHHLLLCAPRPRGSRCGGCPRAACGPGSRLYCQRRLQDALHPPHAAGVCRWVCVATPLSPPCRLRASPKAAGLPRQAGQPSCRVPAHVPRPLPTPHHPSPPLQPTSDRRAFRPARPRPTTAPRLICGSGRICARAAASTPRACCRRRTSASPTPATTSTTLSGATLAPSTRARCDSKGEGRASTVCSGLEELTSPFLRFPSPCTGVPGVQPRGPGHG